MNINIELIISLSELITFVGRFTFAEVTVLVLVLVPVLVDTAVGIAAILAEGSVEGMDITLKPPLLFSSLIEEGSFSVVSSTTESLNTFLLITLPERDVAAVPPLLLLLLLLLAVIESVLFARLSEIDVGVGVEVDMDEDARVSIGGTGGILSVVVVAVGVVLGLGMVLVFELLVLWSGDRMEVPWSGGNGPLSDRLANPVIALGPCCCCCC